MSRGRFTVLLSVCRTYPFKNPRKPYPLPTNPYRTFPCANNYLITTVPTLRNQTLKPVQALRNFCTESAIPPPVDDIAKEIQEILNDFTQAEIAASEKVIEEEEESESDEEGEAIGEEDGSTRDVSTLDPTALFQEMEESKRLLKMTKQNKESYLKILTHFEHSGWVKDQVLGLYINASFFPSAAANFRKYFRLKCHSDVMRYLLDSEPGDTMNRFIFPIFAEFCLARYRKEMEKFREMVQSADMRRPHTWYPFARAMKRKIVYHCGPTNSGKTYNALQRMMEAKSGIYCGPLRLLAMEVFDKVNSQGVYCSLHTGQEKKDVPFAKHISCTVEMMNTNQCWDVAVIDEIQMIGDEFRGYAWSRALLGLLADEIHICGDPSVLHLVKHICASTGDFLDIRYYPRFKPLVVERSSLVGNFTNIQKGDCIVAFSRREIFEIKLAVEKFTKHKCCVIYGGLPPETRKRQATLFNDPSSGYDVLVASDAVGMGLNLNIKRVVFYGLMKYNGDKMQRVQASQVKQIAGRAGRRGSIYSDGLSTTFQQEDMEYLIECLKSPFQVTRKAGLFPCFEQLELFAGKLPDIAFTQLLDRFSEHCRLDGHFFLCRHDNIKKLANMLARIPGLSLEDRFNFCFAPVNVRDPKALMHLQKFASDYSRSVPVGIAMGMPKRHAQSDTELLDLESRHQVLSMYLWLAQHFERDRFPFTEKALTMATDIELLLGVSLAKAKWKPDPKKGSKKGDEGKPKRDSDEASKGDPEGLTKRDPEGLTKRDPDEAHIHESVARQLANLRKRLKEKVPS